MPTMREPDLISKAESMGLESFDTSMPIDWVHFVIENIGTNPDGHVVWCYDGSTLNGYPVGVDQVGRRIVGILAQGWHSR